MAFLPARIRLLVSWRGVGNSTAVGCIRSHSSPSFLATANRRSRTRKIILAMAFLILLLAFAAAAESPPQSLAWPGCPDTCGNLKNIPYPFGIGRGCSLARWYEIDCQRTRGTSIPVLKSLGVVVSNIWLPDKHNRGLITVQQPISYSHVNCTTTQQNDAQVNLRASNGIFMYSDSLNYFVAGGCGSLALMASADAPWKFVGCKSSCDGNTTLGFNQCSPGTGCCMTSITDEISQYSVEFKTLNDEAIRPGDEECRYAFLVERTQLEEIDLHSLPPYVPVVLEWVVSNYDNERVSKYKRDDGPSAICSVRVEATPSVTHCYCSDGYIGNYYL